MLPKVLNFVVPLYLYEVEVMYAYTLSSPNPTYMLMLLLLLMLLNEFSHTCVDHYTFLHVVIGSSE